MATYTITVTDEVDAALKKKAAIDKITAQELIETQLDYYIGCSLYDSFVTNHPVQAPGLSIKNRLEVYAAGVNGGIEAAWSKVDEIKGARE